MIHVILIDSGICLEHCKKKTHFRHFTISTMNNEIKVQENNAYSDLHGTCMVNTIQKYYEYDDVQYTMINVMNIDNRSNSSIILEVMKFIYYHLDVDYLLMGVSFASSKNLIEISRYAEKLKSCGAVLIAPVSRFKSHIYPSSLSSFIKVRAGLFSTNSTYYDNVENSFIGNVMPEFIPMCHERYQIFSGTSLASARCLAFLLTHQKEIPNSSVFQESYSISYNKIHCKTYDKTNYEYLRSIILLRSYPSKINKRALNLYEDIDLLQLYAPIGNIDLFLNEVLGNKVNPSTLNYISFISMYNLSMFMKEYL